MWCMSGFLAYRQLLFQTNTDKHRQKNGRCHQTPPVVFTDFTTVKPYPYQPSLNSISSLPCSIRVLRCYVCIMHDFLHHENTQNASIVVRNIVQRITTHLPKRHFARRVQNGSPCRLFRSRCIARCFYDSSVRWLDCHYHQHQAHQTDNGILAPADL